MQSGIPVITGLNDGAAASIAANALQVGDVIITLGTNGVVRVVTTEPTSGRSRITTGVFCWPYVNGLWIVGGHTRVGASVLGWLGAILGGYPIEDIIELAAAAPPGANGVLFLPYLSGRGTPFNDDQTSGSLHGLTLGSDRQSISRAVLEGLIFALYDVYQVLPQVAQSTTVHITGGGAKSAIWTQIIADIFNNSVEVYSDQPALGAAILAAVGVGIYPTVVDAAAMMAHLNRQQNPLEQHRDTYRRAQEGFLGLSNH
jgi:sugar (pentulose or hexulose) kinase